MINRSPGLHLYACLPLVPRHEFYNLTALTPRGYCFDVILLGVYPEVLVSSDMLSFFSSFLMYVPSHPRSPHLSRHSSDLPPQAPPGSSLQLSSQCPASKSSQPHARQELKRRKNIPGSQSSHVTIFWVSMLAESGKKDSLVDGDRIFFVPRGSDQINPLDKSTSCFQESLTRCTVQLVNSRSCYSTFQNNPGAHCEAYQMEKQNTLTRVIYQATSKRLQVLLLALSTRQLLRVFRTSRALETSLIKPFPHCPYTEEKNR